MKKQRTIYVNDKSWELFSKINNFRGVSNSSAINKIIAEFIVDNLSEVPREFDSPGDREKE